MFLSRLVLNRRSRNVRRDLADVQALHRTILRAFPDLPEYPSGAREHLGVLHRLDEDAPRGELHLYVQSSVAPCWERLPEGWATRQETRPIEDAFAALRAGDVLAFRLRANPTKRLGSKAEGKLGPGKRVALLREEDQIAWLGRKAKAHGFELVAVAVERPPPDFLNGLSMSAASSAPQPVPDVRVIPEAAARGWKPGREGETTALLTFGAVVFEGRVRIADAPKFRTALAKGIGSGKAYGFGLLSVARAEARA